MPSELKTSRGRITAPPRSHAIGQLRVVFVAAALHDARIAGEQWRAGPVESNGISRSGPHSGINSAAAPRSGPRPT